MCSGAIVKYRFPDAVMYPINYGDEFPFNEIEPEDTVYMVDFCLQPFGFMQRLSMLLAGTGELIVIDHHKTTLNEWSKSHTVYGYWLLQTDKAACELTWEYLFPDKPVPLAVKLLSLYDSWRFQGHELEDMVLPFQMRLRMEELDPRNWGVPGNWGTGIQWDSLFNHECLNATIPGNPMPVRQLIKEGRLLLRYDEARMAKYVKEFAFETTFPKKQTCGRCGGSGNYDDRDSTDDRECPKCGGYGEIQPPFGPLKAIAVNLGHTNSKVFDSVWDESKYDLMITFVRRKDKLWNVSLYSTKEDVDCGAICKSFGGGGHFSAAGFTAKELPFDY